MMKRRGRPRYPELLTPREQEVLALLRDGLSNEQIGGRLEITERTVKFHVSEIIGKLGVRDRHEAAQWTGEGRRGWFVVFAPLGVFWRGVRGVTLALSVSLVLVVSAGIALLVWGVWVRGDDDAQSPSDGGVQSRAAPKLLAYADFSGTGGVGLRSVIDARLIVYNPDTGDRTDIGSVTNGCYSWSRDGTHLAFPSDGAIRVAAFERETLLTVDTLTSWDGAPCPVDWSASGDRFLLDTTPGQAPSAGLWLISLNRDRPLRLVQPGDVESISGAGWLADDRRVAGLVTNHLAGNKSHLLVIDARTGVVEQDYEAGENAGSLALSNDDRAAVITSSVDDPDDPNSAIQTDLVVIDLKNETTTALGEDYTDPRWSPTGDHLLVRSRGGELVLLRSDGSLAQRFGQTFSIHAEWSKDGSSFVLEESRYRDGHAHTTIRAYVWNASDPLGALISQVTLPIDSGPSELADQLSAVDLRLATLRHVRMTTRHDFPISELLLIDPRSGATTTVVSEGKFALVAWQP